MKKLLFILILLSVLTSCTNSVEYALVSGEITNPTSDTGAIRDNIGNLIKKISINKDGSFSDTIYNVNGYYNFSDGNEHSAIYLENGYNLKITLDTNEFDETISYTGKGSEENNYLAQKYLLDETTLGTPKDLFMLNEKDFLAKITSFEKEIKKKLNATGGTFQKKELVNLKYELVLKQVDYERYHAYLSRNPSFKVSDDFPNLLKDETFDNEELFKSSIAYQQLTTKAVFTEAQKQIAISGTAFNKAAILEIKKVKSELIKNNLLEQLSVKIRERNEDGVELYNDIMALSTNEEFKEKLTEKFNRFSELVKGKISPIFENYENYKGGTSSLSDFKGKYVYIDVWATWCAPCKAEIPALKVLSEKYKDKDIVFVSISVDKKRAYQAWKDMIKEKEMDGVQLYAPNDWNSKFVQEYGITGIPRFILIDKEGMIVNANAPRPSDPGLIMLFNKTGV